MSGLAARAAALAGELAGLDVAGRLAALRAATDGRIVFTTSFGVEDQAIAHFIGQSGLDIEVATLDTGRMYPETYDVWMRTEAWYGLKIRPFYPEREATEALVGEQGINGFRASIEARKRCCGVRKVEPLGRALAGAAIWLTGLRAEQSENRAGLAMVEADEGRGLIKAAPIFDWSRDQLARFIAAEHVPYNELHDRGFPSIGCAPCTRAVRMGEPERAGRWWWEDESRKECGLHSGGPKAA
ncbi:MAG: phosphoadenylyl-sulfate reductase [Hyphomicrobiaceae bacterium]|nr:phosphoadenylyl-sulfate reductase [Hyphomicrobiaceae bacterium]